MTKNTLSTMLNHYKVVYIKPNVGTYGGGVMKVEHKSGSLPYVYQNGLKIRRFASKDKLYADLSKIKGKRPYLVQKGIDLRTWNGRIFDLRVMVQRSPSAKWKTTGIIGRAANPRKVVTNYHNGGSLVSFENLLAPYTTKLERLKLERKLRYLGIYVAKRMVRNFPGIRSIGLDIGLDKKLHPWIIEVNTRPDPYIFRKLADKRIYAKVIRYHRFNNR